MRFRAETLLLAVFCSAVLVSCAGGGEGQPEAHRFTRFAMGTVVEYVIVSGDPDQARGAMEAAHTEVERVSRLLWEEDPESEIHAINASCDSIGSCRPVVVSLETARFLSRAEGYWEETSGRFDVAVGGLLRFYDFVSESPATPDTQSAELHANRLRDRQISIDSTAVTLSPGVRIAVGGVAKGYAVDRAIEVLRAHGITGALVNAGGDLYCLGTNKGEPWRVGIRDPDDPAGVVAALEIADAAVATSGDYQQFSIIGGVRYHHILDPSSGLPARRVRSATIVSSSAERADALATGLFVTGEPGLQRLAAGAGTEAMVVTSDGGISASDSFPVARSHRTGQD